MFFSTGHIYVAKQKKNKIIFNLNKKKLYLFEFNKNIRLTEHLRFHLRNG